MKIGNIVFVCLAVLLLSFNMIFSQTPTALPSIVDPLYVQPIADPLAIPKFVNPLPVIQELGLNVDATAGGSFTVRMEPTTQDVLGTGHMTTVWGYGVDGYTPVTYPGSTFETMSQVSVTIEYINNLPAPGINNYPLPIDPTLHYTFSHEPYMDFTVEDLGVPAVPHLHGGHTDSDYDGLPEYWWTPLYHTDPTNTLARGPRFVTNTYVYENSQEAGTLWYHDHALGITRLNVYMGLAGFYLLRDQNEINLINGIGTNPAGSSLPTRDYEIEMAIQDRMFYPDGQLAYPNTPSLPGLAPNQTVQPEFFGEVILVNGKAWPFLDVEPRKYRFRVLNGSDSRFYNMRLVAPVPTTVPLWFTQLGTEDGFLPAPISRRELLIGPGERYDVVVDFSDPALAGQTIIIRNNARSPFPKGMTVNPNTTGQIMAFRVTKPLSAIPDNPLPASLRPTITPLVQTGATRNLLLFEGIDEYGRLKPMLGTIQDGALIWDAPITENPTFNDVEVWEVYNTTMDAHPIHLHLVAFQILDRQNFSATQDPVTGALTNVKKKGRAKTPSAEEAGWKDTAIMYPGEVTRVIAKFDKLGRYVWHCHILSHEDHEMMRPYEVIAPLPDQGIKIAETSLDALIPDSPVLDQNYPNPFNPTTEINFSIPEAGNVQLIVYNTLGQEVITLARGYYEKGSHNLVWDARDNFGNKVPSGVYIYRLTGKDFVRQNKMMLIK